MGNCLVLQGESIRIMKLDGKVLEYKAPMQVNQLLLEYPDHAVADSLPIIRHLQPDAEMLRGHLYYLLPLQTMPPPKSEKKKVRFINSEKGGQGDGVVRIKLVISKQELKEMLDKGGNSIADMTSQICKKASLSSIDMVDSESVNRAWKPVLESIPEAS